METDYIGILNSVPNLSQLLQQIDDITIIEYDFNDYSFSYNFANYLARIALDCDVVKRIVLLGGGNNCSDNIKRGLKKFYSNTEIQFKDIDWEQFKYNITEIPSTLVIHVASSIRLEDETKVNQILINERCVYSIVLWGDAYGDSFFSEIKIKYNLILQPFNHILRTKIGEETVHCKELKNEISEYREIMSDKDFFYHCVRSSNCGCAECNQCLDYGRTKRCPFMLSVVAEIFRDEGYLPKNEKIAHQWEIMAARQRYLPSEIKILDDIVEGIGCDKNELKAFEGFVKLANDTDDIACIAKVVEMASNISTIDSRIAVPYLAKQADNGDESAVMKLYSMFEKKECGLPDDLEQMNSLLEKGASTGNSFFMEKIAKLNESKGEWKIAFEWYKKLYEANPEMEDLKKLQEIKIHAIADGSSIDEITELGMKHIFGDLDESDMQLGEECLIYAVDMGYAKAKWLYGWLKYRGCVVDTAPSEGLEMIESAAKAHYLPAMDFIYRRSITANDVKNNAAKIKRAIEKGIENGDREAMFYKGLYIVEERMYKSESKASAVKLIKRAADFGIARAQYQLGMMYRDGINVPVDKTLSKKYFIDAALNGNVKAKGRMGVSYAEAKWGNELKTFRYLKLASVYEEADVMHYLGICFKKGIGTVVDEKTAFGLFDKSAKKEFAKSYYELCKCYYYGIGVQRDYQFANFWGGKALSAGFKELTFEVAYSASEIGRTDEAIKLYKTIANNSSAALNNLACLESDSVKKSTMFKKAADMGDDVAQANIASRLKSGTGIDKNIELAIDYYTKSANQGYLGAIKELARIFHYGDGVDADAEQAIRWYKKAIEKGDDESIYKLGYFYEFADCISHDYAKALECFKLASEKGIVKAMNLIGDMYCYGRGVGVDESQAIFWYRKAAKKGDEHAKSKLKELNANWIDEKGNIEDTIDDSDN